MIFLFENFAESRLVDQIGMGDTVLRLPPSDAADWPKPTLESHRATVVLLDGVQEPEIVWIITNPGTGNVTVERGMEGTSAKVWRAGTAAINTPTKASLNYLSSGGSDSWHDELVDMINEAYARIVTERDLRINADGALASQIETIGVGFGEYAAMVGVLQQAFSDIDSAWAQYQIEVEAKADDAVAKATQSLNTSVTNGTAIAQLRTDVETAVGDNFAAFANKIEAFTDFNEAQVVVNTNLTARVGTTETSLANEIILRSEQYLSQVEINNDIETRVAGNSAGLSEEITVRSTADAALATRATNLESEVIGARNGSANLNARINTVESTAATANGATAGRVTTLESQVNTAGTGILARLTTEETTRATADTALSNRTSTLEGQVNTPTTGILARLTTEETTRATADTALAGRTTTLEGQVNTPTTGILARLTTEETTRAAADVALSGRTTTLESQMNTAGSGVLARLTAEETTRATADAALAGRATTLEAQVRPRVNRIRNPSGGDGLNGWTNTTDWSIQTNSRFGTWFFTNFAGASALSRNIYQIVQPIGPGQWTLSGRYSLNGLTAGAAQVQVIYWSATGYNGEAAVGLVNGEGDFSALVLNAPAGTTYVWVRMALINVSGNAEAFFGFWHLKLEEGAIATAFTDDATLANAAARITTEETARAAADAALATRTTTLEARANGSNLLTKAQWTGAETSYGQWTYTETAVNFSPAVRTEANGYGIPGEGALQISQGGRNSTNPNANAADFTTIVAAEAGKRYSFSSYTGAIDCRVDVQMRFLNAAGAPISTAVNASNDKEKSGSNPSNINNLKRIGVLDTAPAGTALAELKMRKYDTQGLVAESYAFFSRHMYGEVALGTTELPPWAPGVLEARLTTTEQVAVDAQGKANATYGVTLNVNGKISGFGNVNNGITSEFAVQADRFKVSDGAATTVPFVYSGGVLEAGSLKLKGSIEINDKFIVAPDGTTTIRNSATGQRLVISNSLIQVYDASNNLRVRLGIW